jgi:hypothetical protein
MMSIIFTWRKRPNTGLVLILIGLTSLVQSFIVLHAQTTLGITSIFLLVLVPAGVSLALSGVELSLAETIYRRSFSRERKPSKWKTPQRTSLRALFGRIETASVFSVLLVLALSFVCYWSVIAMFVGTGIPIFARFVLAESAAMLVAVCLGIIAARIM